MALNLAIALRVAPREIYALSHEEIATLEEMLMESNNGG